MRPFKLAVVGGGISGLAAAWSLADKGNQVQVQLFEAGERLGGVLRTEKVDDFQVELGADRFITNKPWGMEFCKKIGFEEELIPTNDRFRKTFVVHAGRLCEVPEGFVLMAPHQVWPVVKTPILSVAGKIRLAWEWCVPRKRDGEDESLAHFVKRRLGREVFERLVQPLVAGIYTADAEQLSLLATLPRFVEMERQHGSWIRAALKERKSKPNGETARVSGARYSLFVTPRRGLSSLVQAIADRLPPDTVKTERQVLRIAKQAEGGWQIVWKSGDGEVSECFDGVVVATPAPLAGRMLQGSEEELAKALKSIPYAGAGIVSLGYREEQFGKPLAGFGFVVPEVEQRKILACSFSSIKFAGRAPQGKHLLRVFVGGAKHPELVDLPDEELKRLVHAELRDLLQVNGEPEMCRISRYRGAMPQYHVGHLERVAAIEATAARCLGLELAGNAYHGVGIPDCIHSGQQAADRLWQHCLTLTANSAS